MSAFLAGVCLGTLFGYVLRALLSAAERETRPIPAHRPRLRLVTGEELERRAAEARN